MRSHPTCQIGDLHPSLAGYPDLVPTFLFLRVLRPRPQNEHWVRPMREPNAAPNRMALAPPALPISRQGLCPEFSHKWGESGIFYLHARQYPLSWTVWSKA